MNLTRFLAYLQARRDGGETLAAIGENFGVSHVAVTHWLSGKRKPSSTVLVLAGELCLRPMEMASGLPVAAEGTAHAVTRTEAAGRSYL
jgi:hypothetical protein